MRGYAPVIIFQPVNPQPKPNPPNLFQTYKKQQNEERERKKRLSYTLPFSFFSQTQTPALFFYFFKQKPSYQIKPLFYIFLVKLIPINLISHHHHPKQKNRANNLKGKGCPPLLTDAIILQPSQCLLTLSG